MRKAKNLLRFALLMATLDPADKRLLYLVVNHKRRVWFISPHASHYPRFREWEQAVKGE